VITFDDFLRRLPKVELHCHLVGTLRLRSLVELAAKNRVGLPVEDPSTLYDLQDFYHFLNVLDAAAAALREPADFALAAYESLEDGVRYGNLRYREMFFNPTTHATFGVPYGAMLDGLIDGIQAAERDFGVRCRLIPSIDRRKTAAQAVHMVEEVLDDRRDEVIGLGMDYAEKDGPPQRFTAAYNLAARGGLHLTAHACEDNQTLAEAPPRNVVTCLDDLGCERLDHGYNLLADEAVTRRCREQGVYFTVCATTSNFQRTPLRRATIKRMHDAGLKLTLNTDDPAMFGTDLGDAFVSVFRDLGWGPEMARQLCLNSVDACWLEDAEKRALRESFEKDIELLSRDLDHPQQS
jgi:adenosine deaminase